MRVFAFAFAALTLWGQGSLDPAKLLQQPTDSWPTYNGDYSGQRYSPLTKINSANIGSLSLAWTYRANPGRGTTGGGGDSPPVIKGTPLVVNGILYVTAPDHVWAVDARSGRELWHYAWKSRGGWHIGNRGAAYGEAIFISKPRTAILFL